MQVVRILGVDPGSRLTGFGCIDLCGNRIEHVSHGTLKLCGGSRSTLPIEERLLGIFTGLSEVIEKYRPEIMVVEKVFFAKNAMSALKLGQARGAVILSGMVNGLKMAEYNPTEVKASVAGYGQADKSQVARMVQMLTKCGEFSTFDATDALALAVCHAHRMNLRGAASAAALLAKKSGNRKKISLAEAVGVTAEMAAGKKRIRR
jgi:crossover junction endodeoxyribonuclease RuvC